MEHRKLACKLKPLTSSAYYRGYEVPEIYLTAVTSRLRNPEHLEAVLSSLIETVHAIHDINFAALEVLLLRYGNACAVLNTAKADLEDRLERIDDRLHHKVGRRTCRYCKAVG